MNEPTRQPPGEPAAGKVDFGYEQVPREEKARRVRAVFDSVAARYDLMNDLMSGGLHRLWKQLHAVADRPAQGSERARRRGRNRGSRGRHGAGRWAMPGSSCCPTSTPSMLAVGRDRLLDRGSCATFAVAIADAERLPFARRGLRLRDHRLRTPQRHRQARGARVDAPRAAPGRAPARARVLATRGRRR